MSEGTARRMLVLRCGPAKIRSGHCAVPSLLLVAMTIVLAGCQPEQTQVEVKSNPKTLLSESRVATQVELPPFYDSNNLAEFYGRCPKCDRWTKGYWRTWDYGDSETKVSGAAAGVNGACEACQVELMADDPAAFTSATRIVRWKIGN